MPVVVYESRWTRRTSTAGEVTHDPEVSKGERDVVIANRWSEELADVVEKACTRDLLKRD